MIDHDGSGFLQTMKIRCGSDQRLFLVLLSVTIVHFVSLQSVSAACDLGVVDRKRLYNYSLASPIPEFPHGVLSEDGYRHSLSNICSSAHECVRAVYEFRRVSFKAVLKIIWWLQLNFRGAFTHSVKASLIVLITFLRGIRAVLNCFVLGRIYWMRCRVVGLWCILLNGWWVAATEAVCNYLSEGMHRVCWRHLLPYSVGSCNAC